jgi:hypothetical protein
MLQRLGLSLEEEPSLCILPDISCCLGVDVLFNGFLQLLVGMEIVKVIHLTLQGAPETLHWCIVETSSYP